MSENDSKFEFTETYRKLQPGTERSIISFREATHKKVRKELPKSTIKIVDLARLAFEIPTASGRAIVWLEEIVKEKDAQFSLEHDRNEARIIATILLADMIASGFTGTPALVLTGSFVGRRQTVDQEVIGPHEVVQG
ncbi:hypothetical protein MKK65_08490 [Methylobacterium sp. J-001]|uniref:GTPase-associated system all-helical protein GASH n=1 Tax=Methylobacterium sp. J-001 TaxID=2836609 RepID=UPI001FBA76A8|nr:GTPase-associated system all-helical protein GASH [Methylobacterium sp. J-001]MCJ2116611.1 hypothetical protein [Methylobacterium sp. J-001]